MNTMVLQAAAIAGAVSAPALIWLFFLDGSNKR